MVAELKNLEKLHSDIQTRISHYCRKMLSLHRENLTSIVIYGSAAGSHYIPKRSNINLILIFQALPFSCLKNSLNLVASGRKRKILAPLFLTGEHITSSCDIFPIEFFDIKENHLTLYGEDIFQRLEINQSNLRLQCEQEIKGKLVRLRQSYLEMGIKKNQLVNLLSQSVSALMPVFRAIIRLNGGTFSQSRDSIIREIAKNFQLQEGVFFTVLNIKEGNLRYGKSELENIMEDYFTNLYKLAQKIDKLSVHP